MRAIPRCYRILVPLLAVAIAAIVAIAGIDDRGPGEPASSRSASGDTVVRVVDGDTVVLRSAGRSRLIGVDTPEVFGSRECFGAQASSFAKRMLPPGLRVTVQRDAEPRDSYGRSLLYLTLADGRSFNELLVEEGFAVPLEIAPNTRHAGRIRELADRAREEKVGLWSPQTCAGRVGESGRLKPGG